MKHIFDVDVATQYGVNAAILFENIGFWVHYNRTNQNNYHDGTYWTFNSRKALRELFPYMGDKQLRNATQTLVDAELLITGNYNENFYDRTLWYALTEKGYSIWRNANSTFAQKTNESCRKGEPIPDIKPNIKPDKGTPSTAVSGKSPRHEYGQYKNVMLTDKDMDKLKAEYPDDWQERIERLSEYMASKGTKYKNHLATIRAWARKDASKPTEKPKDDPYENYTIRW